MTTINDTLTDTYPLTGRRIAIGLGLAFLTWSTIHYWGPRVEGYLEGQAQPVIVRQYEGQPASTEPLSAYTGTSTPFR